MMENKIIPNEIYIINKMNFVSQAKTMIKVSMTLKDKINPLKFLDYIGKSLAFGRCIVLVTFDDKEELNGCAVLLLNNIPLKGKILWIEWAWTNGKDLTLGKRGMEIIMDLAQKLKADKIAGAMTRGFKAMFRKYEFKEAYRVLEIEVKKENVEKN
jgi:hypothetical protein